jgi:hypothetical protein
MPVWGSGAHHLTAAVARVEDSAAGGSGPANGLVIPNIGPHTRVMNSSPSIPLTCHFENYLAQKFEQ